MQLAALACSFGMQLAACFDWQQLVDPCTLPSRCLLLTCLQEWKAAADAACPLPPGMHYSANVAVWSMLAGTLYAADPRKADQQGGLHVNVVVDVRDGRCDESEARCLRCTLCTPHPDGDGVPCHAMVGNLAVARHLFTGDNTRSSSSHVSLGARNVI
jgi:hypothetical protein